MGGGLGDLLKGNLGGILGGAAAGSVISGGLGDLLKQLQQNGHGETANSWVSPGPNKQIAPNDLASALGADQINGLMSQTGLSREDLLSGLSQQLPGRDRSPDAGWTGADRKRIVGPALIPTAVATPISAFWIFQEKDDSHVVYFDLVGLVAGIIARLISPGPNNPSGFILTAVLGIAGAFLATFIGQMIGHYGPEPGRRLHHRDHRRAGGAVHLEPAGRQPRDSGSGE